MWHFLLSACGPPSAPPGEGTVTADTGSTSLVTTPPPQSLSGVLTDTAGIPLVGWDVKLCNELGCRNTDTDAGGAYEYPAIPLDTFSFEPVPPNGSGYATAYVPLAFAPDERRVLDIHVPMLGPTIVPPVTPQELELGAGLFVTVGADDLEPPSPFAPDVSHVAGVRVDPADYPPFDGLAGTVLGVWYLAQFDYRAPAGLPVRIGETLGVADGVEVRVYVGSYDDFAWLDAGTLTASGGQLTGAARLPLLSTVVVVAQ